MPAAQSTPARAGTGVVPVAAPAAEPQAPVPAAQAQVRAAEPAVESGGPSEASGSYADPDDDWGPPRDEDAPPLDEEPPLDWDPSPAAAPSRPEPAAAAAAPARKAPAAPASKAAGSPAVPGAGQDASADAWARAVEQSPGVWTVGTNSNVGGYVTPDAEPAPVPEPAPVHYEPAAAQIPEYAGVVAAASGLASGHPARAEAAPAPAVADSVAPRAAAAAVAAVAEAVAVAAVPEAPAPAGRQSLYQRLSNSPEAEAGRAKAPARAAAPTVYVQDIPSADDETIEESGVFGRAAVERILGGKLVEERSLDGSPLPPRF
jgi:DNA polymerase-3 subunit gamma/tau